MKYSISELRSLSILFRSSQGDKNFKAAINGGTDVWLVFVNNEHLTTFRVWGEGDGYQTKLISMVDMADVVCMVLEGMGVKHCLSYYPKSGNTSAYYYIKRVR